MAYFGNEMSFELRNQCATLTQKYISDWTRK